MRIVLLLCLLTSLASAEVCKDSAACEKACAAKDLAACTFAAERHFEGKDGWTLDQKKSLALSKRACDGGDAFGCALLGYHYQDGLGTAYAPKLAIAAYEKACKGGAGVGCFNLASMYYGGHGVAQYDTAKGDEYTKRARAAWEAACKGSAPRWCTNLAFLEASSSKAPPDAQAKALELNRRACDAGVTVGCLEVARGKLELGKMDTLAYVKELDRLCLRMNEYGACGVLAALLTLDEKGIAKDSKKAMELYVRACDGGDKSSCFILGLEYARGENAKQDFAATTRAFDRACDRAYAKACLAIAQDLASRKETKRATGYARRACHMGNGEACGMVSALLPRETKAWATDGCRMGHIPSCGTLIKLDAPLPLPADVQKRLYTSACNESKVDLACKRLAKLK
jgi:TPR repeat protein